MQKILDDPFFIVYDARSGSTFIANLLIKNALVAIPPETTFITRILEYFNENIRIINEAELEKLIDFIFKGKKFRDWGLSKKILTTDIKKKLPISLKEFILEICEIYRKKKFPNSIIFGIKKGSYMRYFKQIIKFFPDSKFICLIRDGRAVFNSKKTSMSSKGKILEDNPYVAARLWCEAIDIIKNIEILHEHTLIIHYEDLIQESNDIVNQIANFLEVSKKSKNTEIGSEYSVPERYRSLHKHINKKPLIQHIMLGKIL